MNEPVMIVCVICKSVFERKRIHQLYCSVSCRQIKDVETLRKNTPSIKKEKVLFTRVCPTCNKEFTTFIHNKKSCSSECNKNRHSISFLKENKDLIKNLKNSSILKLRVQVMERDGFCCQYCGRSPMKGHDTVLHVDHKFPRSKGGTDEFSNLITACSECNLGKHDYILEMWRNKN